MIEKDYIYITSSPDRYNLLKAFAKANRANMTYAERVMWEYLRDWDDDDVKFRRQHIIGDFIVDFACLEKYLVIEIDGGYHAEPRQQEDDLLRTQWLNKMGYKVIRFSNEQVIVNIDDVIEEIRQNLQEE